MNFGLNTVFEDLHKEHTERLSAGGPPATKLSLQLYYPHWLIQVRDLHCEQDDLDPIDLSTIHPLVKLPT